MKAKSIAVSLAVMLLYSINIFGQTGEIRGRVTDESGGIPLAGANVVLVGTDLGAAAGDDGYYVIYNVPTGIYNVTISFIGYGRKTVTDIVVKSGRINTVNAMLELEIAESEYITVSAGYYEKQDDTPANTFSLNHEEIRRSPGAREDVSRKIQNLAGVNPGSDDRNDLVIRGGSPTEVLFKIDGFDIPNPNHFATQGATGGPISLIGMEFINNVEFMAGGFSAPFGHKLSGVVDIKLREGNRVKNYGMLDVSFAGAGGYYEGPIQNGRGSFLIGAHKSYLDLFKSTLNHDGIPQFFNVQGKLVYDLNDNHQFSLLVFNGDDKIEIVNEIDAEDFRTGIVDTMEYSDPVDFSSNQVTFGAKLRSFWNQNMYTNLYFSHSRYEFSTASTIRSVSAIRDENDELNDITEIRRASVYNNESVESVTTVKNDFYWSLPGNNGLSAGIYAKAFTFDHEITTVPFFPDRPDEYGVLPETEVISRRQDPVLKTGGYFNLKKNYESGLTLNIGARYDYFDLLKEGNFSPRIGIRYTASPRWSIYTASGRYYQSPEFINITGDESNVETLKDLGSDHFISGMEYLLSESVRLTIDAYYKRYFDYPVVSEPGYEMVSLANIGSEYGNTGSRSLVSKGKGNAYGIETMLQKKVTGHLYGLVSYSFSRIKHKALDGVARPGAFDNRHVGNLVAGYRFSEKYEFSMKWRYAGGRPYTPYDTAASSAAGTGILNLDRINEERYRDYSRVDLRFDTRDFYKNFTLISYMSIENIFDTKNVLSTYWNNGKVRQAYQAGRFIVGGISIEF